MFDPLELEISETEIIRQAQDYADETNEPEGSVYRAVIDLARIQQSKISSLTRCAAQQYREKKFFAEKYHELESKKPPTIKY